MTGRSKKSLYVAFFLCAFGEHWFPPGPTNCLLKYKFFSEELHFKKKFLKSSFQGQTHIGGFLVVVNLVYSPGQAKVSNLHNVVLCHQNVSCCQISVNALQTEGGQRIKMTQNHEMSLRPTAGSPD